MNTLVVITCIINYKEDCAVINGMKADIHDLGVMVHVNIVTEPHARFTKEMRFVYAQNLVYKPDTLQQT